MRGEGVEEGVVACHINGEVLNQSCALLVVEGASAGVTNLSAQQTSIWPQLQMHKKEGGGRGEGVPNSAHRDGRRTPTKCSRNRSPLFTKRE
jgi:hypothetical protein